MASEGESAKDRSRELPGVGKRVLRLGLSCTYGLDAAGLELALERGVNYVFWTSLRSGPLRPVLRRALAARREQLVIACGPTLGYFGGSVRRAAERHLKELGTDYLDVFQLFWLGKTSALTEGTQEELLRLKQEGKVRAIGASIHDRPRAGRLAEDSVLDLLMIRYNAAHPGAEKDIFPHLARRRPAVVAYTATAWRKLLKAPRGYSGRPMTAAECYRFCLTSPHVDVVLSGPSNRAQLEANLAALDLGPLTPDEEGRVREFGRAVHG